MNIRFLFYPFFVIGAALSSCGSGYENEVDPVTAMYDSIAKADSLRLWGPAVKLSFDEEPDYQAVDLQRVTIEGYIGLSDSITQIENTTIIQLWQRKGQRVGDTYSIAVNIGTGINTMDSLPENYSKGDLRVRDHVADIASPGDRVRITGIYHRPANSKYGSIDVQVIEKLGDVPFDYSHSDATPISPDVASAVRENALVVAEGYIIVPSSLKVNEFASLKLIAERSSSDSLSIAIPIGGGVNQISELPDNYTDEDVQIRDFNMKPIEYNHVRIYGVWHKGTIVVEHIVLK